MLILIGLYILSWVFSGYQFIKGRKAPLRINFIFLISGLLVNTLLLIGRYQQCRHLPLANLYESLLFFAWALALIWVIVDFKFKIELANLLVIPVLVALILFSFYADKTISPLKPILKSPWFGLHAGVAFFSYASFALAFLMGLSYLIHESILKKRSLRELALGLPPLEILDMLNYRLITLGFLLLSLALISGSVWAKEAWGSWWSWDPKQTWSFITWLAYALLLHLRLTSTFRGRKIAIISILGFGLVLFTYMAVNYFFTGLHSFL